MKYRRLGDTGLKVSQLGLGTMPFGGDTDESEAQAIVTACLDAGINLFDCADVYNAGAAETILAARRPGPRRRRARDQVRVPECARINRRGASPAHLRASRRGAA